MDTLFGRWTSLNGGGNIDLPSFFSNPAFDLTLTENSALLTCRLTIEEATQEIYANISIFRRKDSSASSSSSSSLGIADLIASSGNYSNRRSGVFLGKVSLLTAGCYRIYLSTFLPVQVGTFSLRIYCTAPLTIKPVNE